MKITKQEILDTALDIFAERGYDSTILKDISDRLNVTKSALYKHYESKEALWDALIDHVAQYYSENFGNAESIVILSQGQRQLLAIARAAVADPPVLILDEATSSIDTRTERIVQEGMDRLMKGRTTFVIAHRLSTVRNSDCIIVLEQGRVIERGNHDQLMAEKGKYYQLYTGNSAS